MPDWPPKPRPQEPEEPKQDKPKKNNPPPELVKIGMFVSLACTIATVVAWFIPGAKPYVQVVVTLLRALLAALGV